MQNKRTESKSEVSSKHQKSDHSVSCDEPNCRNQAYLYIIGHSKATLISGWEQTEMDCGSLEQTEMTVVPWSNLFRSWECILFKVFKASAQKRRSIYRYNEITFEIKYEALIIS